MKFNRTTLSRFLQLARPLVMAAVAVLFSASAMAQYMWLDASGKKVFSDQPPPANIPKKQILQQPGMPAKQAPTAASQEASAEGDDAVDAVTGEKFAKPAKPVKPAKPEVVAAKPAASKDKDLEAAKKKIDDEAAAKKKVEQEARDVAKAENCERAKGAKLGLASGGRIATVNAKGERVIMDDAARQVETKRIEGIIAAECK
jgi:type IV secretory pathway VirB10-like protein